MFVFVIVGRCRGGGRNNSAAADPQSGPQSQPPHSKPQRPKRSCHERSNEQHHSFSSGGCVTSASKSGSAEWSLPYRAIEPHRVREMTYRFVIMHSLIRGNGLLERLTDSRIRLDDTTNMPLVQKGTARGMVDDCHRLSHTSFWVSSP